jgi:hypothetical protein
MDEEQLYFKIAQIESRKVDDILQATEDALAGIEGQLKDQLGNKGMKKICSQWSHITRLVHALALWALHTTWSKKEKRDKPLYIWLGKNHTCFGHKGTCARAGQIIPWKNESYEGVAGDEWICAVIIAHSQGRAFDLMKVRTQALVEDWTWENLGVAQEQKERIEVLAFGQF